MPHASPCFQKNASCNISFLSIQFTCEANTRKPSGLKIHSQKDPCRQLTASGSCGMCFMKCTKTEEGGESISANKICQMPLHFVSVFDSALQTSAQNSTRYLLAQVLRYTSFCSITGEYYTNIYSSHNSERTFSVFLSKSLLAWSTFEEVISKLHFWYGAVCAFVYTQAYFFLMLHSFETASESILIPY